MSSFCLPSLKGQTTINQRAGALEAVGEELIFFPRIVRTDKKLTKRHRHKERRVGTRRGGVGGRGGPLLILIGSLGTRALTRLSEEPVRRRLPEPPGPAEPVQHLQNRRFSSSILSIPAIWALRTQNGNVYLFAQPTLIPSPPAPPSLSLLLQNVSLHPHCLL